MLDPYYITVILISFGAALSSGLLGIGDGIIVIPSFLYLMPLLGFKSFSVNEITGIAATQTLAGIFFAFLNYLKNKNINFQLVKVILPISLVGGIIGSVSAKYLSELVLLIIYFALLILTIILMLIPKEETQEHKENIKVEKPYITKPLIFFGTAVSGALGFAGAVMLIPLLNHFCKVPIKQVISNTIGIVLITSVLVFIGKASVGLVSFDLIFPIIIGAIFGANIGVKLNKKISSNIIKKLIVLFVVIIEVRIFFSILEYWG